MKLLQTLFVMLCLFAAGAANAAGLTVTADAAAMLGAIDLGDAKTIILSVGAGLGVVGAIYYAVRKGLRMIGA